MWIMASDLLVILHFLWILFLLFGAIIGRKIVWVKWLHIAGLMFAVVLQIFHWTCPLTALEHWLSQQQDESVSYVGDFLPYYISQLVYVNVPPLYIFIGTLLVILLSLWAYLAKSA